MAEREVSLGLQTPLGGAEFRGEASLEKGAHADLDVSLKPDMTALASGAGGAAAYTWLAAITGPWTPFVLLGAGLSWLALRHIKEGRKAKEQAP